MEESIRSYRATVRKKNMKKIRFVEKKNRFVVKLFAISLYGHVRLHVAATYNQSHSQVHFATLNR